MKVATMVDQAYGILSGDAVESGSQRLLHRLDDARSDPVQAGFHLCPARPGHDEMATIMPPARHFYSDRACPGHPPVAVGA
jgi:hypothetical protein